MSYLTLKSAKAASLPVVGTLDRWPANPPHSLNTCLPTDLFWYIQPVL